MRVICLLAILLLSACASQPSNESQTSTEQFNPVDAAKTRISLGLTYLKNDNYKQAKFNLDKALKFAPKLADAHMAMGYYYQLVGDEHLANSEYQNALKLSPNDADIANSYGAYLCQRGNYDGAKKYFLQAIHNPEYIQVAETYENLALCSQNAGKGDEAIGYLKKALQHDPGRTKSLVMLVQLYIQHHQWAAAKQQLQRYEKVGSVSADTIWFWVRIEQGLGHRERAEAYGNMLVQMYPASPYVAQYIAWKKKQQQKAASLVAGAASSQPEPPSAAQQTVNSTSASVTAATETQQTAAPRVKPVAPKMTGAGQKPTTPADAKTVAKSPEIGEKHPTEPAKAVVAKTPKSTASQPVAKDAKYHIVKRGENLYKISLKYNIRMHSLLEWNHLKDPGKVYAGMKLRLTAPQNK